MQKSLIIKQTLYLGRFEIGNKWKICVGCGIVRRLRASEQSQELQSALDCLQGVVE